MSSSSLSSLRPNLEFFEILIFRGDILKNMYKKVPPFLASIFPLYTLIPNSETEKNLDKNVVSSTNNAARKLCSSSIDR